MYFVLLYLKILKMLVKILNFVAHKYLMTPAICLCMLAINLFIVYFI